MSTKTCFVLTVDGYVQGVYSSQRKAKAAWLRYHKSATQKNGWDTEYADNPFRYTRIDVVHMDDEVMYAKDDV